MLISDNGAWNRRMYQTNEFPDLLFLSRQAQQKSDKLQGKKIIK